MEFHGSETEKNLQAAFIGESQARNKYMFYAAEAKKAGFIELSEIYTETAKNEFEHAKVWFKHLHDEDITDTIANLNDCIQNEAYENLTMYPNFAKIAEEEGFAEIAQHFKDVAKIEGRHQKRFQKFLEKIETQTMFERPTKVDWECSECGNLINAKQPPKKCPVCDHPQGYFIEHCEC